MDSRDLGSGSRNDVRSDAGFELDAKVDRVLPRNVPQVPRVEVKSLHPVLSAAPDHRAAKPAREAGFEVDALPLAREISDDELGASNLGQHPVGDSLIRACLIDPKWQVGACTDCLVRRVSEFGIELIGEPAGYKTASWLTTRTRLCLNPFPPPHG